MWGSIVTPIKHTFPQELKFREKRASFVLLPHVKLSFFNLCYKDLTYSVPIRIFLFIFDRWNSNKACLVIFFYLIFFFIIEILTTFDG